MTPTARRRPLFQARRCTVAVHEALALVMEDVKATLRSPRAYGFHATRFAREWGQYELGSIAPADVEDYIRRRLREVKPATVVHELSFLSRVFRTGVKRGWCLHNPVREVSWPKIRNGRDRILSSEEESRLRREMAPADFAVVRWTLLTGMRRGEVFWLQPQDICTDTETVHLPGERTKTGEPRAIPLHPEALALFEAHAGPRWVWVSQDPDRERVAARWYESTFQAACRRVSIEGLTFHGLRHSCASRLVMAGVGPVTVKEILGHADLRQTQRYMHLAPGHTREAISRLR